MQFRDLKTQYQVLKPEIDVVVERVMTNSNFINGKEVTELENKLAEYVGVKHCITCANGTDALTLAIKAWALGKGDAIFVPDFTFFSSAEIIALEGATPIFVDVEDSTFNIDPIKLEKKILEIKNEGKLKLSAVIAVDLFGLPAKCDEIRGICNKYDLLLLEDGAQGFGGNIDGKMACSFGDISTTSFFPAKPLGCYGDGGAVFTDNDEWAELIKSYKVHGKGDNKYDNIRIGLNSRLDTIQAAILDIKLDAFRDNELDSVNNVANIYSEILGPLEGVKTPVVQKGYYSSWAQYTIILESKEIREKLQMKLKENDIPSMIYYQKPMHNQEAFSAVSYNEDDYTVSNKLCETVLSLPMHPYLKEEEIIRVCEIIKSVV